MPTSGHCGERGSHAAEHAISRLSTNDVAYHRFTRQAYKPWITPAVDIPQLSQEPVVLLGRLAKAITRIKNRSEEQTSELQSLMRISYAVVCLKKKIKTSH